MKKEKVNDYQETFKRKEMKYLLTPDQRERIEAAVAARMQPSEFGHSTIRSLYYDTPAFDLIERSLDKPLYKEKLRLRTYGEPSATSQAFVELKKKYDGVVHKRRVGLSLLAAQAFLDGMPYEQACSAFPLPDAEAQAHSVAPRSLQIAREIDFMRQRHDRLGPRMLVVCERDAYADPEGSELRITFDTQLECVREATDVAADLALEAKSEPIIDPSFSVLEVKNAGPLPLWLTAVLAEAGAYPSSFSKYGRAYLNAHDDLRAHAERRASSSVSNKLESVPRERSTARDQVACAARSAAKMASTKRQPTAAPVLVL